MASANDCDEYQEFVLRREAATDRNLTIMSAGAILRGLAVDLKDPILRKKIIDLSVLVCGAAVSELESQVRTARGAIRELSVALYNRDNPRMWFLGGALRGVLVILIP